MQILYKICPAAEWSESEAKGVFCGYGDDYISGFIHLSTALQVRETARRHFAEVGGLVLVAFAEENLAGLQWQPSRGGDLFPHVHGVILISAVRSAIPLPLKNGAHVFPAGIPG